MFVLFLVASIFNGFMIAQFTRLNIFWHYCGMLCFITSLSFIFILIYSSKVYVFREVFEERIYGFREILWNISMFLIFLVFGIVYLHYSFTKFMEHILLISVFGFTSITFYLVLYLALSKSIPSKLDKAMTWFFIGIAYTMIWLYVIITVFNILISIPSMLRIFILSIDAVCAIEGMAIYIVMQSYTPLVLIAIGLCISIIELNVYLKK